MERRRTAGKDSIASDSIRVESPSDVLSCTDLRDNLSIHTGLDIGPQVPP